MSWNRNNMNRIGYKSTIDIEQQKKIRMPHCPKCDAFQVILYGDCYECLVCGHGWD